LRPGKDLTLDWKPLFKELKSFVLPHDAGNFHATAVKKNVRILTKMCSFAQFYFDPEELPQMLEEFLPYVSYIVPMQFISDGCLSLQLRTQKVLS
jgi:proteasome activator subunit 4